MAIHVSKGNGAPGSAPTEIGQHYVDEQNGVHYLSVGNSTVGDWVEVGSGSGGATTFTDLTDTPSSYVGQANRTLRVSPSSDGIAFSDTLLLDNIDTPNSYTGFGTFNLRVKADETGIEFIPASSSGLPSGGTDSQIIVKLSATDGDADWQNLEDQNAITALDGRVSTNETSISSLTSITSANTSNISTNAANISNNQSDISTNKTDITNLQLGKEDKAQKGVADGYAPLGGDSRVPKLSLPTDVQYKDEKSAPTGYASLDAGARVPKAELPVDTVFEASLSLDSSADVDTSGKEDRQSLVWDQGSGIWGADHRDKFRGDWVAGTYKRGEIVRDGSWLMYANTETTDRAGVIDQGIPSFSLPDAPTWTPITDQPLSHTAAIYTLTEAIRFDGYRFYRPTSDSNIDYNLFFVNDTDSNNPILINSQGIPAGEEGWVEINIPSAIYLPGTILTIEAVAVKTGNDTSWSHQWIYKNSSGDPGSKEYHFLSGNTDLRIHQDDNQDINRSSDLDQLKNGDEIRLQESSASTRWQEVQVAGTVVKSGSVYQIPVLVVDSNSSIRDGRDVQITATIHAINDPAPAVTLPDYWLTNNPVFSGGATVQGHRSTTFVQSLDPDDNAYGMELRGVIVGKSDDWDIMAFSGDLSGGAPTTIQRFTELLDTPSDYIGEGGKFVKVADDEGGLEFSTESETTPQNNTVYVDVTYGDDTLDQFRGNIERPFKTIKAAADYVATQSPQAGNDWAIRVQPGLYLEEPFVLPQYTALSGTDAFKTNIFPTVDTSPQITIGVFNNLTNLNFDGNVGLRSESRSNAACIFSAFAAGCTLENVLVNNYATGIQFDNGAGTDIDVAGNNVAFGQFAAVDAPVVLKGAVTVSLTNFIAISDDATIFKISDAVRVIVNNCLVADAAVVVDITGGPSIPSVIIAVSTMNRVDTVANILGTATLNISDATVEGTDTGNGIVANGASILCIVSDSTFFGFATSIDLDDSAQGYFSDCIFTTSGDNVRAIQLNGFGSVYAKDCQFVGNSPNNTVAIESGNRGFDFPFLEVSDCFFFNYSKAVSVDTGQAAIRNCQFEVFAFSIDGTIGIEGKGNAIVIIDQNNFIYGTGCLATEDSNVRLTNVRFFNNTVDFKQQDNSVLFVNSSVFNEDQVEAANWNRLIGTYISTKLDDFGLISLGKLKVGVPEVGQSSALGEGSSYTRGILVYEFDATTLQFNDVSSEAQSPGGTPFGIPNTSPNSALYIGSSLIDANLAPVLFYGLNTTYAQTQENGQGRLLLEFFDGSAWVAINSMTTQGTPPYNIVDSESIELDTPYNVRLQDTLARNWQLSDPVGLGTSYYWIRLRVGTDWPSALWPFRLPITIAASNVTGLHNNFPVYVDLSQITDSQFWTTVLSDGADIRVGTTAGFLAQDLVWINKPAQTGELYFSAPTLDNAQDNTFYIYFGYASAQPVDPSATNGRFNVWLGYDAVYHLQNNTYEDATSNALNGTAQGTINVNNTGAFGRDISTTGNNNDVILLPDNSVISDPPNDVQWECWVTASGTTKRMACGLSDGTTNDLFTIGVGSSGNAFFDYRGNSRNSGVNITDGNYHYLVYRQDRRNTRRIQGFVDAVRTNDNSGRNSLGNPSVPPAIANTGAQTSKRWNAADKIDEVRVTSQIKNDDWIRTQYDNMSDPASFIAYGTIENETDAPGTPIDVVPQFTQIKLWPSCTYLNEDGFQEFYGNARPIVRSLLSTSQFKDTAGTQTATDGDEVWLSKEFGMRAPFRFTPNEIKQITDVAVFGSQADLSSNARIRIHFIARDGASGDVLFKLIAATTDASTIYETQENLAPEDLPNSVSLLRLYTIPADGGDKDHFVDFELNFPARDFQASFTDRSNLIWATIERQGTSGLDTFSGNVDIITISSYFTTWRVGEHITFF